MKAISKAAKKVLDALTENMDTLGDSRKIDNTNETFMPVHVDFLNTCDLGNVFSVTHYYEQNGDLMRDPEMQFIKGIDGEYYPISFWQDSPPMRNEVVFWKDGEITGWMGNEQAALVTFANTWMRNIKEQQGLVI